MFGDDNDDNGVVWFSTSSSVVAMRGVARANMGEQCSESAPSGDGATLLVTLECSASAPEALIMAATVDGDDDDDGGGVARSCASGARARRWGLLTPLIDLASASACWSSSSAPVSTPLLSAA